MLQVSKITGVVVYAERPDSKGMPSGKMARLGKVHMTVFSPEGTRVVGFLVKQPDVAGMIKRPDVFLALDSLRPCEGGIRATRGPASFDDVARERLGLDWDRCIMWTGMDAKTTDGKELGYVADAEFNTKTGKVSKFYVGDGNTAKALVGQVEIPASMLVGYEKGWMLVSPEAAHLELNGGAAARAGESYAKAKIKTKAAAEKAGAAVDKAVDKGSKSLGVGLGKARRAVDEAMAPEDQDGTEAKPQTSDEKAREVGKHISALPGAFGSFWDEFKKNSQ